MKNKNLFKREVLKSFRSSLWNKSTYSEAVLWKILKSKQLYGRKFRKQYRVGMYILDFCCPSEKFIIELEGNPHGEYHNIPINHPGRKQTLHFPDYYCTAATPPSKGGEIFANLHISNSTLNLTAMPLKGPGGCFWLAER